MALVRVDARQAGCAARRRWCEHGRGWSQRRWWYVAAHRAAAASMVGRPAQLECPLARGSTGGLDAVVARRVLAAWLVGALELAQPLEVDLRLALAPLDLLRLAHGPLAQQPPHDALCTLPLCRATVRATSRMLEARRSVARHGANQQVGRALERRRAARHFARGRLAPRPLRRVELGLPCRRERGDVAPPLRLLLRDLAAKGAALLDRDRQLKQQGRREPSERG
eukprot:1416538-Prymnesium_polylepis.2